MIYTFIFVLSFDCDQFNFICFRTRKNRFFYFLRFYSTNFNPFQQLLFNAFDLCELLHLYKSMNVN